LEDSALTRRQLSEVDPVIMGSGLVSGWKEVFFLRYRMDVIHEFRSKSGTIEVYMCPIYTCMHFRRCC